MKNLRVPQVYDEFVLEPTFIEGLQMLDRYSMRAFWSGHKDGTLQKMSCKAPFPRTLQAASTRPDHVATRATTNRKLWSCQQSQQGKVIYHIDTSSREQLTHATWTIPTDCSCFNASSTMSPGSTRTPPNSSFPVQPRLSMAARTADFAQSRRTGRKHERWFRKLYYRRSLTDATKIWRCYRYGRQDFITRTSRIITPNKSKNPSDTNNPEFGNFSIWTSKRITEGDDETTYITEKINTGVHRQITLQSRETAQLRIEPYHYSGRSSL